MLELARSLGSAMNLTVPSVAVAAKFRLLRVHFWMRSWVC